MARPNAATYRHPDESSLSGTTAPSPAEAASRRATAAQTAASVPNPEAVKAAAAASSTKPLNPAVSNAPAMKYVPEKHKPGSRGM